MSELLRNDDRRLRAFWHPVARLAAVGPEPQRVELLGEALALVRLPSGIAVLPDRCPHRWARLSDGRVVDGHLECPYHGWRFDQGGTCTLVPALGPGATVPTKAAVPAVRTREAMGLVWVALDEPVCDLLAVPEWDDPTMAAAWLPDVTGAMGAAQFVDNFLDVGHFPFVHAGTFGAGEDAAVADYEVERLPHGLEVRYEHLINNHEDPGVLTGERPLLQPRVMEYTYQAPYAARLRLELPMTGVVNTIVGWARPETAGTTVLHTVLLRNDLAGDDGTHARHTVDYELAVLAEDLFVLERLPSTDFALDLPDQVHTRADRITVELRRQLRAALDAVGARSHPTEVPLPVP